MKNYHSFFKRQLNSYMGFPNRAVSLSGAEVTYTKWVKKLWMLKALKLKKTIMKNLVISEVLINCRLLKWDESFKGGGGITPGIRIGDLCHFQKIVMWERGGELDVGVLAKYNLSSTFNQFCLWIIHTKLPRFSSSAKYGRSIALWPFSVFRWVQRPYNTLALNIPLFEKPRVYVQLQHTCR